MRVVWLGFACLSAAGQVRDAPFAIVSSVDVPNAMYERA
jgi:hypothetical protein